MKLKEFSRILKCFKEISADQPFPDGRTGVPLPLADVPDKWLRRFKITETILTLHGDKTPRDLGLEARVSSPAGDPDEYTGVQEFCLDQPLWSIVALPCDYDDIQVLRAAGCDRRQINTVRAVMNEFFDGPDLLSLRRNLSRIKRY